MQNQSINDFSKICMKNVLRFSAVSLKLSTSSTLPIMPLSTKGVYPRTLHKNCWTLVRLNFQNELQATNNIFEIQVNSRKNISYSCYMNSC